MINEILILIGLTVKIHFLQKTSLVFISVGQSDCSHSAKESYRLCKKDYETEEEARAQQKRH
jgi:hypothetical protein